MTRGVAGAVPRVGSNGSPIARKSWDIRRQLLLQSFTFDPFTGSAGRLKRKHLRRKQLQRDTYNSDRFGDRHRVLSMLAIRRSTLRKTPPAEETSSKSA